MLDIQPPVVSRCPTDRHVLTSNMTSFQTWNEPSFSDPHGLEIKITKNYLTTSFEFPWGEFTVQYSALKPSNGMKAECLFNISVKRKVFFSCRKISSLLMVSIFETISKRFPDRIHCMFYNLGANNTKF